MTDLDALTATVIRHAFFYAHYRFKYRKVTPRSIAFLKKYRDTAKAAMKTPSRNKKIELATLNQILHSEVILFKQPSEAEIKSQAAMKQLIEMRYYADYGAHMAGNSKRFQDKALEQKLEGIEYVTGSEQNWTVVQKRMELEEEARNKWRREGKPGGILAKPDTPTITAVKKACTELKLDHENTRFAIKCYSRRNEATHCKVNLYIQQCDWKALAPQLWKDIQELRHVFDGEAYRQMQKVLHTIKDRYFDELEAVDPEISVKAAELSIAKYEKLRREAVRRLNASQVSTGERTPASSTDVSEEEQGGMRRGRKTKSETGSVVWDNEDQDFGLDGVELF